jgi:hypothetical protein
VIDRPIRPLFPKDLRNDVALTLTVMSVDPDCSPEITAMIGASVALSISDIPWNGPIGGVFMGLVDGKPVVSIYDLNNLLKGLGGVEATRDALQWLDSEAKAAGLAGVHFQFIRWSGRNENLSGVDGGARETGAPLVEQLGFSSLTHYQFVHFTNIDRDYGEILSDVEQEWEKIVRDYHIPYCPHVSVGWDNNPRYLGFRKGIVKNNTPEAFEKALRAAKALADRTGVPLITVNSWNEWTETSYLEPDNLYGYGYLEAIRRVFKDDASEV